MGANPQEAPLTIHQIVQAYAENQPDWTAIAASGRSQLSYTGLYRQIQYVAETLNFMNIGRNDRVAVVLPNGPEMAVVFLSVASTATCAPLNPAYRTSDYEFYLSDLNAKALITLSDFDTPADKVAQEYNIPIIYLDPDTKNAAGSFKLSSNINIPAKQGGLAQADDVALVLHTSGTTSRPKMVPLQHKNLCASAFNIQKTLLLTNKDRCLNVMPLFHIHGLIGALLSSISAGASIVCTPGFQSKHFFEWIDTFKPSWYSAVPTIHQSILGQIKNNRNIIAANSLRFIRSSSASLPPKVMKELEEGFNVPVVESYGMTEASHQMTSNPLPPLQRKPGTVGIPAGPEVGIMDTEGNLLTQGETGEIVIRGLSVTRGYENNPEANKTAFTHGWFRTGDEGYFDSDGYLYISGRIKEIINRGGEKISPREIDETFLEHPEVIQAVSFSIPHPTLGEDLAVAVVLEGNSTLKEKELRDFSFNNLPDFKVPSQVIFVEEIPKGATGKLQRLGLAKLLENKLSPEYVAPSTNTQIVLADLMADVLKLKRVGVSDNFFTLGGNSLLAAVFFSSITEHFGRELPLATLFQAPTIEELAKILDDNNWDEPWTSLVEIQPKGSKPPIYFVHPREGNVIEYFPLAYRLGLDQPFYGLQAEGLNEAQIHKHKIPEMAEHYIREIKSHQPTGPFYLGGFCLGGAIAFEMAQQLLANGEEIAMLAMVEPSHNNYPRYRSEISAFRRLIYQLIRRVDREIYNAIEITGEVSRIKYLWQRLRAARLRIQYASESTLINLFKGIGVNLKYSRVFRSRALHVGTRLIYEEYKPLPYPGDVELFYTEKQPLGVFPDPTLGWGNLIKGKLNLVEIPGHQSGMLSEPRVRLIAQRLRELISDNSK